MLSLLKMTQKYQTLTAEQLREAGVYETPMAEQLKRVGVQPEDLMAQEGGTLTDLLHPDAELSKVKGTTIQQCISSTPPHDQYRGESHIKDFANATTLRVEGSVPEAGGKREFNLTLYHRIKHVKDSIEQEVNYVNRQMSKVHWILITYIKPSGRIPSE